MDDRCSAKRLNVTCRDHDFPSEASAAIILEDKVLTEVSKAVRKLLAFSNAKSSFGEVDQPGKVDEQLAAIQLEAQIEPRQLKAERRSFHDVHVHMWFELAQNAEYASLR